MITTVFVIGGKESKPMLAPELRAAQAISINGEAYWVDKVSLAWEPAKSWAQRAELLTPTESFLREHPSRPQR